MSQGPISGQAFLLRTADYGESDQVLTLFLRSFGKISCMARGARKSKRRFGTVLRPFCQFEVELRSSTSHTLSILESAHEMNSYSGLLSNLDGMAAAWRLLELLDKLEEPGSAHPEMFDSLDSALGELSINPGDVLDIGLRCEAAFVALHGWAPRVDACVSCLKPWPFDPARFSMSAGGLLCNACKEEGSWVALHPSEAGALRTLFGAEAFAPVAPGRSVMTNFIQHQLGKALRTDQFDRRLKGDSFDRA